MILVILVILVTNCCRHREQTGLLCLQVGRLPQAAAEPATGVSPSSHTQVPIHAGRWPPDLSVRGTGKGVGGAGGTVGDHGLGALTAQQPRTWALGLCSLSAFFTTVLQEGSFLFGKTGSVKISVQEAELRLGPAPPLNPRVVFRTLWKDGKRLLSNPRCSLCDMRAELCNLRSEASTTQLTSVPSPPGVLASPPAPSAPNLPCLLPAGAAGGKGTVRVIGLPVKDSLVKSYVHLLSLGPALCCQHRKRSIRVYWPIIL